MFWPFRRKKKSPFDDLRDSPEIWRAGDLAEYRGSGTWERLTGIPSDGPKTGQVVRVVCVDWHGGAQFLRLSGFPPNENYHALHFRKIQPRADELTRAEPEFISLLTGKPVREVA